MADEVEDTPEVDEEEIKTKKVKVRKVVRRRKTKKERENPITVAIRLAVESGSVEFGARASISTASGKAKLLVIASNTPPSIKEKVEKFATGSKIPVIIYDGSSVELGSVCGKPFPVSVLSVYNEGSSNILDLAK
ncbi:50S ribosomal protein L30e [Candidatus Bilamarchaeum dharawalense]|uniref:Large ribosomal subunit protein eL30 n=1 Tax=Candidatus Bilamarchaeum dharawalense TaxID=2885759 RepID=A0A5E4LQX7_9ARCH|nr:50S ribosomal protein L30e [Candidatus Bilamarchaeum dharawalense]